MFIYKKIHYNHCSLHQAFWANHVILFLFDYLTHISRDDNVLYLNFSVVQVLQFHVFDWDDNSNDLRNQDKLGWVEVTLAEIMSRSGEILL